MNANGLKYSILGSTLALIAALSAGNAFGKAKLPVVDIGSGKAKVTVEVADSEEEIQRGLMYRTGLAPDAGMIFIFHPHKEVNFWMYNCFISLDMLFVRDGKIVKVMADVPPCKSTNPNECPTYPGGRGIDVTEVIELAAGYAKQHDIHEGDTVSFQLP